jgi:hypothetical protein
MALDYAGSATLIDNTAFRSRVKIACLSFAHYIIDEPSNTAAHNTRVRWAHNTLAMPDTAVMNVTPTVVMDDKVQAQGETISDADLQVAVEEALDKLL